MDRERARQPEQKAVRRQAILDAARSLFTESSYDEISLNGVARKAAMTRRTSTAISLVGKRSS